MASHDLMDDEGAGGGGLLVSRHCRRNGRRLRRPSRRPSDWRIGTTSLSTVFGQADDGQIVAVGGEVGSKVGGCGVGVVAADRVENGDAVIRKAFGGDPQRVVAFLDEAALDAVGGVGELDTAVPDRRAAIAVQQRRLFTHLTGDLDAVAEQYALVAGLIGDDIELRRNVAVAFDEAADGGGKTGCEASGGQHCNFLLGHDSSYGVSMRRRWLRRIASTFVYAMRLPIDCACRVPVPP